MSRASLAEVFQNFAETTTISGLFFIQKAKSVILKIVWFLIFVVLVTMTVIQCNGAIQTYLSYPNLVTRKLHFRTLTFPSVTFCATNPFKASQVGQSPEIEEMLQDLQETLYGPAVVNETTTALATSTAPDIGTTTDSLSEDTHERKKRQVISACPSNYFRLGGGCYMKANMTVNWNLAYNICKNYGADLPIFTNFSNYMDFFRWRISNPSINDIWIGLYSKANLNWTWSNGCPYNAWYPSFWGADVLTSQGSPLYNRLTTQGALWSDGTGSYDVYCYLPASSEDSGCKLQGFQMSPNAPSILCNNSLTNVKSWWCVADHPEYSTVSTAMQADSCFCLLFNSSAETMSVGKASRGCENLNGTLMDFRSSAEVDMIFQLISNFNATDGDLMNACPYLATYANRSCFNYVHYKSNSLTNAEYYCRGAIPGSHLMSLHSQYEHNAAYYELWKHYAPDSVDPFGVYFGMYRNYSISPLWKWTDGTPFDYLPGWSIWAITGQPNADPEAFFIMRDGLLHDYSDITTNGICKKNITLYPLWTSLETAFDNQTGELSTAWSNTNCSILADGLPITLVDPSMINATLRRAYYFLNSQKAITPTLMGGAPGAICRLDRKPSTTSSCYSTSTATSSTTGTSTSTSSATNATSTASTGTTSVAMSSTATSTILSTVNSTTTASGAPTSANTQTTLSNTTTGSLSSTSMNDITSSAFTSTVGPSTTTAFSTSSFPTTSMEVSSSSATNSTVSSLMTTSNGQSSISASDFSTTTVAVSTSNSTAQLMTTSKGQSSILNSQVSTTSAAVSTTSVTNSMTSSTNQNQQTMLGLKMANFQAINTLQTNSTTTNSRFDALSQIAKYQEQLLYITQHMDVALLSNLSYTLLDILMHASYDGASLNFSDFTEKYYAGTGNCFTFNSKDPLRTANKAGNDRGFELILKLNILEYLITSVSPGFLFLIHNANQTIYPDSQAVKISTGLQSTVVLTYGEDSLQPYPYSDCLENPPEDYSVDACNRACEQLAILTYCDCADPNLPLVDNATYCTYDMEPCVGAVKSFGNFSPTDYGCSCPQPCQGVYYDQSLSFSTYIPPAISNGSSEDKTAEAKYTAKVNIFFRTLEYSTYERSSAYTFSMLVSDLAQFLGLWLGFSAITFFEIIPLVGSICDSLCGCCTCCK